MQGKITPEHKIKKKAYAVKVVVDEKEESITSGECLDCVAAQGNVLPKLIQIILIKSHCIIGGCKHCVAFILWMHRRSEEPAITSTKCYWQGSKLAKADIIDDDIATILGKPITFQEPDLTIVSDVVSSIEAKEGIIFQFFAEEKNDGSMHNMWRKFLKSDIDKTTENYLAFAESMLNDDLILRIEKNTRGQAESPMWFEMRFARITASIVYEAARAKTFQGTLRERILGAESPLETEAITRGKKLEPEVLKVVATIKNIRIDRTGLFLNKEYPIFGASPDGISEEYVIEIKCPFSTKTVERYIKNGIISKKFYYQVQLQMMFAKRQKALFCVASPTFEMDKRVEILEVDFEREEIMDILDLSKQFWVNSIYPQLVQSYV